MTSLVLGALIFPALSSLAGSALFWLAARPSSARPFRLLRRVLGLTAFLASARSLPRSSAASPTGLGWIRALTHAADFFGAGGAGGGGGSGGAAAMVIDPKWVRNSIGAALVLLTRDAFELVAGVLENRTKASRRIVERPFRPRSASVTVPVSEPEPAPAPAPASSDPSLVPAGAEILQGLHAHDESPAIMSGGQDEHGRPAVVHNLL